MTTTTPSRTRTRRPTPPTAATLKRLKLSAEVAWYLQSRGIKLPTTPPRWKTPEPDTVRGTRFDPNRVDRVMAAFRRLRHTKGRWAGKALIPDPWQVAYILAPVFGWVRYDTDAEAWVRCINHLYVDVPRKNGKSTLVGGIGMYLTCADGEAGAEVIAAATTKDQARFVFDPVLKLASSSPEIKRWVKPRANRIIHPASGSYMEPVASVAEAQHGGNIHGALVDELHVHKTADLLEALETGTGSRAQPLVVIITTADDGRQDTIYHRRRDYVERLARNAIRDVSTYGVIWCADEDDDPYAEATWRKANPGFGISPSRLFLQKAAKRAENSPVEQAAFFRYHLGLRRQSEWRYFDLPVWDRNAGLIDETALRGAVAFGGLDLASTTDLCSLAWTFPADDGSFDTIWRHWCPEHQFHELNERTAGQAEVWRREGWLVVTPGNVADYGYIREQINRDRETFRVAAIGYDRWNASPLVTELQGDGAPMVQVGQGYRDLSAPLKQIKHLLLQGTEAAPRYRHGGNPLMRWQTYNLAVAMDPAGNVKPDKGRATDKIDGWSAATDAMAMAMTAKKPTRSAYEDGGLEVV